MHPLHCIAFGNYIVRPVAFRIIRRIGPTTNTEKLQNSNMVLIWVGEGYSMASLEAVFHCISKTKIPLGLQNS